MKRRLSVIKSQRRPKFHPHHRHPDGQIAKIPSFKAPNMLIPLSSTQIPNPAHRRCRRRRRRTSGTNRSPQPMKRRVLSHPIDPARPETDPIPSDSPQNSLSPAVSPQKNPQKTKLRGEKSGGSMEHRNRTESSEKTVRSPYSDLSDGLVHPILAGRGVGSLGVGDRVSGGGARSGGGDEDAALPYL